MTEKNDTGENKVRISIPDLVNITIEQREGIGGERTVLKMIRTAYNQQREGVRANVKGWGELPIENKVSLLLDDIVTAHLGRTERSSGIYSFLNHEGIETVRDIKHELKKMRLMR